jgi:hypothetical protein
MIAAEYVGAPKPSGSDAFRYGLFWEMHAEMARPFARDNQRQEFRVLSLSADEVRIAVKAEKP